MAEGTLWAKHEETQISVERPEFCAKGNGELRWGMGRGEPHLWKHHSSRPGENGQVGSPGEA